MNANSIGGHITIGATPVSVAQVGINVVRLKAGWVGQVLIGGEIVHELKPKATYEKAWNKANAHVAKRLASVLS